MEKVSVIIPVFNGAATIAQCLDSVFAQDYPNIEVVIVDGKSKDNTVDILNKLSSKYSFTLVSEKDNGIYDAMNKGIGLATGGWLYFLGADDMIYNSTVFTRVFADDTVAQADMVYGSVLLSESKKVYDGKFSVPKILKQNISHQAIFYRAGIFDKLGKYDLNYGIAADYVLNLRIFGDSQLKKHFTNTIIAIFAETGLSGTSAGDRTFKEHKNAIVNRAFSFPWSLYHSFAVPFIQVIDKKIFKKNY